MVAYGCPHWQSPRLSRAASGLSPKNKKSTTGQAMGTTQRCNLADDEILGRSAKGELTDDSGGDRHARLLFVLRLPECLVSSETVISAAQLRLRPPPSSRHALKPMTSTTLLSSTMHQQTVAKRACRSNMTTSSNTFLRRSTACLGCVRASTSKGSKESQPQMSRLTTVRSMPL